MSKILGTRFVCHCYWVIITSLSRSTDKPLLILCLARNSRFLNSPGRQPVLTRLVGKFLYVELGVLDWFKSSLRIYYWFLKRGKIIGDVTS